MHQDDRVLPELNLKPHLLTKRLFMNEVHFWFVVCLQFQENYKTKLQLKINEETKTFF